MALTADTPLTQILGDKSEASVYQAVTIYEGAILGLTSGGYARGLVAGDKFIGHATEYVNNASGSSGDRTIEHLTGRYRLKVAITSVAITDVGRKVYASADNTYTLTAGSNSFVGVIVRYVTTNTAIVEFRPVSNLDYSYAATVSGEENIATLNLTFSGTGGPKRGIYFKGEIAGAGHSNYGMFKFRTYLSAAASATVHSVCANLHLKDAAEIVDAGEWASSPLYVTVETEVTSAAPDLSGGSLAGIYIGYYVDESGGAPSKAYAIQFNNHASYNWDGLLRFAGGDLGDYPSSSNAPALATGDIMIPILRDNTKYYLVALADTGV